MVECIIMYPKRIAYSSRLPKKDKGGNYIELASDCIRYWCTSRKSYFTGTELDNRDKLIKQGMLQ